MKKIIFAFFLLTVFIAGFLPVKDTDFGWHYRCGNQFLKTGKLCLANNFSYFLSNYKAYYSGHFYDILLAYIYNHGGFIAVSLFGSFIFLLTGLIYIKLIEADLLVKIIAYFVVFFLSYSIFNLGLRPQIISLSFLLFLFYILKQKNKFLYFLPFVFFLWVNTHIGFFIGLFVLLFYFFDKKISNKKYLIIVFLSFFATLINPFGINVYKEIMNHITLPLNTMIAEWVAPDLFHVFLIVFLTVSGVIKILNNRSISIYKLLLLVFFSILAVKARRNLPLFYITFFFVFLDHCQINLKKFNIVFISLLTSFFLFITVIQIPKTVFHTTSWSKYCSDTITTAYPCRAIKNYQKLSGNVFANYEWGGFLIWQKPEIKVFVDGRMPAWKDEKGKSPYQVYLDIIQTKPGWNEKLKKIKTDYLLIANGTFLDLLLQKETKKYGWKEVYRDNLSAIYKNTL